VRTLSGSAALAASATAMDSGLAELTDAQLEQVAGGGGKPGIASGGTTAGTLSPVINAAPGTPLPDPDGSKGGVAGNMG